MAIILSTVAFAPGASACLVSHPYNPARTMELFSIDEIVSRKSMIVEGVVAPPAKVAADATSATSVMRVDRVWNGSIGGKVTVRYNLKSADCTRPPPFGVPIRFTTRHLENGEISYYNSLFDLDLPLDNQKLDEALRPYRDTVEP